MSLKYQVGDLIEAAKAGEVNVIAHGCNCYCTMGRGIAPLVKKAFPEAYVADLQTRKADSLKLGTTSHASALNGSLLVFNVYQQFNYDQRKIGKRDLSYDALYDALTHMEKTIRSNADDYSAIRIGIPKLGAGLAGGNWSVIEAMVASIFHDWDVTVYVLTKKDLP